MKFRYALFVIYMMSNSLRAQDFNFSQYHWAPIYVNPALTGNIDDGQHRVILKHRNQWGSVLNNQNSGLLGNQAFKTYMVSYDGRQCANDFFAYGLSVVADVVGEPAFRTYQPQASMAFHLGLKHDAYLAAGFQLGAVHHRFDNNNLSFDNQFDPTNGYDPGVNPQENWYIQPSVTFLDMGAGISLYQMDNQLGRLRVGYNVGASVTHLGSQKDYSFITNSDPNTLYDKGERMLRWTGHATFVFYKYKNHNKRDVTVRNLFMLQGPHWQYVPIAEYGIKLKSSEPFFRKVIFGAGARFTRSNEARSSFADAVLLSLQSDIGENTSINLGCDINVSPLLHASKGFGSFEVSLLFRLKTDSSCVKCFGF